MRTGLVKKICKTEQQYQ